MHVQHGTLPKITLRWQLCTGILYLNQEEIVKIWWQFPNVNINEKSVQFPNIEYIYIYIYLSG